jgi:hypothetical protein
MTLLSCLAILLAQSLAPDQLPIDDSTTNEATLNAAVGPRGGLNGQGHARFGISGAETIANFNKHFKAPGVNPFGNPQNTWYYSMVGNPPELGGTTAFDAPIVPVIVDLRDKNGKPRFIHGNPLVSDPSSLVPAVINSPVFSNTSFTSSPTPTQFTDAIFRAEFDPVMRPDWHTVLAASPKTARRMIINQSDMGHGATPNYVFVLNPDGTCCFQIRVDINVFINLLFPAVPTDTVTPVGAAENAGDITDKDISTFLFPATYLFFNGDPSACCVIGFHTFDFEPGDSSSGGLTKFFVLNYSSWIPSPSIFRDKQVLDVTALSHEMTETFNDPFVGFDNIHNITPFWRSPNGQCQDILETGDVIEGLPNEIFPITMNGMTYHPQNEALLQWFEFQPVSNALGGAYSYPDTEVLTMVSAQQNFNCGP